MSILQSLVGFVYLIILGVLFKKQGFYTDPPLYHEDQTDRASTQCFVAAVIYLVTLSISIASIKWKKSRLTNAELWEARRSSSIYGELSGEPFPGAETQRGLELNWSPQHPGSSPGESFPLGSTYDSRLAGSDVGLLTERREGAQPPNIL